MIAHNIYKPFKARLEQIIDESPLIKTLVLKPEQAFSFKTGEFIELTLNGTGEAPFTPSSSPYHSNIIDVTIMKAGYVTEKMHKLETGSILGIRGPFGRGYPVEKFYGKDVVLLAGGVGMAPIRSLLFTLIEQINKINKLILCFGAKTPQDIIYKDMFPKLKKIPGLEVLRSVDKADDNWKETEGVVTVLLDKIKVDRKTAIAVVCGPPVMMKFGTFKLLDLGFQDENIYLSMEKNMSCGLGKCGHCLMGNLLVCIDGPVFTYNEIKDHPDIWL